MDGDGMGWGWDGEEGRDGEGMGWDGEGMAKGWRRDGMARGMGMAKRDGMVKGWEMRHIVGRRVGGVSVIVIVNCGIGGSKAITTRADNGWRQNFST